MKSLYITILFLFTANYVFNSSSQSESTTESSSLSKRCSTFDNPQSLSDCKNLNATEIFLRSSNCCLLKLEYPKKYNLCYPVETFTGYNIHKNVSIKFPGDLTFNGELQCNSFRIKNFMKYIFIFIILIFII